MLIAVPTVNPRAAIADRPKPMGGKVLSQILKNNPKIDRKYAVLLSEIIYEKTSKFKISPRLMTAIIMQESAYKPSTRNCYILNGKTRCDYCMTQINDHTIVRYHFDKDRLMHDLPYCIEAGVRVLNGFKEVYAKKEPVDYWTRFNANNPEKRSAYRVAVNRYF